MIKNYLPKKFSEFIVIINKIIEYKPLYISIIGSYGNKNKKTKETSDFDIIFVFDTKRIFNLNCSIIKNLKKIENLKVIELGVHFQFGFVCSLYFENKPMKWIDIGIMDMIFANNYLVNLPKKDIKGNVELSGINQVPKNQINHISRKIVSCLNNGEILQAKIASYRYLNWLKIDNEIVILKNKHKLLNKTVADLFNNGIQLNDNEILQFVITDIKFRNQNIANEIKRMPYKNYI